MTSTREVFNAMVIIGALTFIIQVSLGAIYVLNEVKTLENASDIDLTGLPIFITIFPVVLPIPITGILLGIFLAIIYFIFSAIDLKRSIGDKRPLEDVFLYGSVTLVITFMIEFIQSLFGIETGSLESENQYIFILSAMYAPIAEEIGFRLSILGFISAILLLINGDEISLKKLFKSLIHPYSIHRDSTIKTLYIFVVFQALLFGLAHILSGGGWEIGKVTTATVAGIYLGYLFVKYGLTTSILGHGFFNIYLLGLSYLIDIGNKVGNLLVSAYGLVILIYIGIVGVAYIIYVVYKLIRGEYSFSIVYREVLDHGEI